MVAAADDLVGAGIVASLARPGGNKTGLSLIDMDISAKQLELLKAFPPKTVARRRVVEPGDPAIPRCSSVSSRAAHAGIVGDP